VKAAVAPLRGTVPSVVPPSVNVTEPVGVPEPPVGATVAVKVTGWPALLGLTEDASVVVVAGAFTWMLADAGPPGPASLEVTVEVVSVMRPTAVPRTRTVMLQDWPATSVLDVLEKVPVPGLMLKIPPPVAKVLHVPPVCVMRVRPAGIVLLNWTLVSGVTLGLVTVTVMIERPPTSIVDGLKLLEIVAGTWAKASPVKDAVRSAAATSNAARRGVHAISDLTIANVPATPRAACRSSAHRCRGGTRSATVCVRCELEAPRATAGFSGSPRPPYHHADGRPRTKLWEELGPINSGLRVCEGIVEACGFHGTPKNHSASTCL
jgi:hypothetical protein